MEGNYNSMQAVLKKKHENCIFSSCVNHTQNLIDKSNMLPHVRAVDTDVADGGIMCHIIYSN